MSVTKDLAGWQTDPAILCGHVSYRQTRARGTRTMRVSATSMRVRVCGRLCDIDRVLVTCGVRKPFADCAVAHHTEDQPALVTGW